QELFQGRAESGAEDTAEIREVLQLSDLRAGRGSYHKDGRRQDRLLERCQRDQRSVGPQEIAGKKVSRLNRKLLGAGPLRQALQPGFVGGCRGCKCPLSRG